MGDSGASDNAGGDGHKLKYGRPHLKIRKYKKNKKILSNVSVVKHWNRLSK